MDETLITKYPEMERRHFWWAARRRLVSRLFAELHPSGEASVLDVGCGSGMTASMLRDAGADVVGIDVELVEVARSGLGIRLFEGDYLETSGDLGEFDLVMALDVVEHFEDEREVLAAIATNTRPGGSVLVTVPAYRWLWSSHDEENWHHRRYTRRSLRSALESSGLRVQRVGYMFPALVVPKAALVMVERFRDSDAPSGTDVSGWANRIADFYFRAETYVGGSLSNFWPFGTSVVALATRPRA